MFRAAVDLWWSNMAATLQVDPLFMHIENANLVPIANLVCEKNNCYLCAATPKLNTDMYLFISISCQRIPLSVIHWAFKGTANSRMKRHVAPTAFLLINPAEIDRSLYVCYTLGL